MIKTEDLAAFYSHQVKQVDYCYKVTSEEFHREATRDDRYTDACLLVARQHAQVVGFAHLGRRTPQDSQSPAGYIRFMGFHLGERAVGNLLLKRAEDFFADWNTENILAFADTNYNFYRFGLAAQSAQLSHVGALLGIHRYQVEALKADEQAQYVLMHHPSVNVAHAPQVPDGYELQLDNRTLDAMNYIVGSLHQDGERVGVCAAHSLRESNVAEVAHATYYVRHLQIEEAARGRGLGRHLMGADALADATKRT
ncbi:hypothetical protein HC928_25310 [bacterium]|nr:hypothetical protein [bacterium]